MLIGGRLRRISSGIPISKRSCVYSRFPYERSYRALFRRPGLDGGSLQHRRLFYSFLKDNSTDKSDAKPEPKNESPEEVKVGGSPDHVETLQRDHAENAVKVGDPVEGVHLVVEAHVEDANSAPRVHDGATQQPSTTHSEERLFSDQSPGVAQSKSAEIDELLSSSAVYPNPADISSGHMECNPGQGSATTAGHSERAPEDLAQATPSEQEPFEATAKESSEHSILESTQQASSKSEKHLDNQSANVLVCHDSEKTCDIPRACTTSEPQEWSVDEADENNLQVHEDLPEAVPFEDPGTQLLGQSNNLFTILRSTTQGGLGLHDHILRRHISGIKRMSTLYGAVLQRTRKIQDSSEPGLYEKPKINIEIRTQKCDKLIDELEGLLAVKGASNGKVDSCTTTLTYELKLLEMLDVFVAEGREGNMSKRKVLMFESLLLRYKRLHPSTASAERPPAIACWSEISRLFWPPSGFGRVATTEEQIFASAASVGYAWLCRRTFNEQISNELDLIKPHIQTPKKLIPALRATIEDLTHVAIKNARNCYIRLFGSFLQKDKQRKDNPGILPKDRGNQNTRQDDARMASLKQQFAVEATLFQTSLYENPSSVATQVVHDKTDRMFAILQQLQAIEEPQKPPLLTDNVVDTTEADLSDATSASPLPDLTLGLPYSAQHYMLRDVLDSFKQVIFDYLKPRVGDAMESHGWHFPENVDLTFLAKEFVDNDSGTNVAKSSSSARLDLGKQLQTNCRSLRRYQRQWAVLKHLRNKNAHLVKLRMHDLRLVLEILTTLAEVLRARPLVGKLTQYRFDLHEFRIQLHPRRESLRETALSRLDVIAQKRRELDEEERQIPKDLSRQYLEYSVECAAKILERGRGSSISSEVIPSEEKPRSSLRKIKRNHPGARLRRLVRSKLVSASRSRPNNRLARSVKPSALRRAIEKPPAPNKATMGLKEAMLAQAPSKGNAHTTANPLIRRLCTFSREEKSASAFRASLQPALESIPSPDHAIKTSDKDMFAFNRENVNPIGESSDASTTVQGTGRLSSPTRPTRTKSSPGLTPRKNGRRRAKEGNKNMSHIPSEVTDSVERWIQEGR
ncbi:hypothetical protein K491DRAFT_155595 [Lophiostoma macrostomum CBS 122681]|uniref:Uncharacterized protein n=1 Tax=Lophiostoma macrostomum CBS 122681 TaxID=1314788 RepID=A0A6A6SQF5_9PLEO|nr:hypothetical protein K491DRAFT_155595 [Lophiostoma macrostomum CBS 122681]